jgi:murein L,D-transpeptidase YafK
MITHLLRWRCCGWHDWRLMPSASLIILMLMIPGFAACADSSYWLLIDTANAEARWMKGDTLITRYRNIAIGRRGAKPVHYQGDDSTPLGEYRIDAINHESRYGIFLSLNYPLPVHARLAEGSGTLSARDRQRIEDAHRSGMPPPYDTALGGMIGIHGIGKGSLKTHREFNWTQGCVALDNTQMQDLVTRVRIGTRVVIQ